MSAMSRWVLRLLFGGSFAVLIAIGSARAAEQGSDQVGKIASFQNQVETKRAAEAAWTASTLQQPLFAKDRIRTGPASRAAILYSDQMIQRLNEKSEIEIEPPTAESAGLLRVISGTHYFSSRRPKDYGRIETPTVTAAIKGTEFVVEVGSDDTTTITMLEGTVEASNAEGRVTVGSGEAAYVEKGKAPVKRVVVRPRDAVAWSLYYPPVLGGADAERLRSMGAAGESLAQAAELLAAGQVDQAKPLIESARSANPDDSVALSLASVIETAEDHKEEATRLANRAVTADPKSSAAALASSFAAQASFDIAKARAMADKAAELDPQSSVALARAAELRMAEGDLDGARKAAEAAVQRTPNEARALSVLGFVELAQYRSREAEKVLERAVAADPSLSLAHLGLGIATIRVGRVAKGREELQTAVALDPENSLIRSYLGKAYYEERRSKEASKEFAAAKAADPSDPTPYLYDAITKQNESRPVEALSDLQNSIELNDRRAVYRSRLLLDQDNAVRGADVARIYNDLGFEQLGLVSARRSVDQDQANFSGHLLLYGNYRNVPEYAPAFFSEALQARIYQPVGANAARPDVIGEVVSFNEYTALFDRPRGRAFGSFAYGTTETDLSKYYPPEEQCSLWDGTTGSCQELYGLDRSRLGLADVIGTYNKDRFAMALEVRRQYDSGFRQNADIGTNVYRGFFQVAPSWRDSIQLNVIYGEDNKGDRPFREVPMQIVGERFETKLTNVGLGYHRTMTPRSDLAVSAIYNDTTQDGANLLFGSKGSATLKGPQVEIQDVWRLHRMTWVFGLGGFDGTTDLRSEGGPFPSATMQVDDRFFNGYAYGKFRGLGPVEITAGASVESVDAPVGVFTPRDSYMPPTDLPYKDTRVSPKLGVSVYLRSKTTLRAVGFYRLSPALGRLQTLEPTQVSGFNQFFEDPGGTWSLSYGVGFDQEVLRRLFFGGSYLRRSRTIQEGFCEFWDQYSGCAYRPAVSVIERNSHDDYVSTYLDATLGKRVTAGLEYSWNQSNFDDLRYSVSGNTFYDYVRTEKFRPQLRFFLPFGLYGVAAGTHYAQRVDYFNDLLSPNRDPIYGNFWTVDAQLGWRLPNRYGSIALEGRNLSDRRFTFYMRSLAETVIPARQVVLRAIFTY